MKHKLLLLFLLFAWGMLSAQDTTLVITEARMDDNRECYIELTNMGTEDIDLSVFELGCVRPWTAAVDGNSFIPEATRWIMLPEFILEPGKSYVIAGFHDFFTEQYYKDVALYEYSPSYFIPCKAEMWKLADLQIHLAEANGDETDSVSFHALVMDTWSGRECWFVRHHISETDSVVVDQVGGVWTDANGSNPDGGMIDVAGFKGATGKSVMVRKFSRKTGNKTFVTGVGLNDSEWMPIPLLQAGNMDPNRAVFWTVGNHGKYILDETTLTSSTISINLTDSILTVPWGVRRDDSIMYQFDRKPGIAWHFDYAKSFEDSAYMSLRTGDLLTVYVCGDTLSKIIFKIQVTPPTTDANIVVPKRRKGTRGNYVGSSVPYLVSDKVPGMDTISQVTFATRVDTLFKYLEKAPNAIWEIVWVDGIERADVKMGDILKVTAENGTSVKEYYIKVLKYRKSRNAYLSSITWPDIPEFYKGVFGWMGDTIPSFAQGKFDYKITVPWDVIGIPALVGKNADVNARHTVTRVKYLTGSPADRTITFYTTAELDTVASLHNTYKVQLEKEKDLVNIQPWQGEPFISEFDFQDQWANYFMEIVNPGTEPLDLSHYMLAGGWHVNSPADAITRLGSNTISDWNGRYGKYIPGYKWVDSTTWKVTPALVVQDLNVNSLVYPGDVFVMGLINSTGQAYSGGAYAYTYGTWPAEENCDIIFRYPSNHPLYGTNDDDHEHDYNVWHEPVGGTCLGEWYDNNFYFFKILNDSVLDGSKTATDPNDFELLESFASYDNTGWKVISATNNIQQISGCVRKPEVYKGNPEYEGSFGHTPDSSEWLIYDRPYFDALKVSWPMDILQITQDLGAHFMNDVTVYRSTVASGPYKVSPGYSMEEDIRGVMPNTTVTAFLDLILKSDPGQTLTLKNHTSGSVLTGTDILTDGDTLIVLSADSSNTSKYIITVGDVLSHDVLLTSAVYTIQGAGETGSVSGMVYGTLLADAVDNVTAPADASFNILDANGAYVSLKKYDYDTNLIDVEVSDQIFFEVIAEDNTTKRLYQLQPTTLATDAFVTSDVFDIDQEACIIDYIPTNATVQALLKFLYPATGATMKIVDKFGLEREIGYLAIDDKLVVTAQDGVTTKVYFLSMLPRYKGQVNNYFAYVLSSVYTVNQVDYEISGSGLTTAITVTSFLGNLTPAAGATATVVDALGVENTGTINEGDMVKVVAADGITTVHYSIVIDHTSIEKLQDNAINIYPNPSAGEVTISGLEPGYRLRVYNVIGVAVRDVVAYNNHEVLSLEDQPDGIYFVVVNDGDSIVGRYKLIIK